MECIDVVEHFNFNIGNAMKYLWRCGLKEGTSRLEDLEKAAWYVRREIERITSCQVVLPLEFEKANDPVFYTYRYPE